MRLVSKDTPQNCVNDERTHPFLSILPYEKDAKIKAKEQLLGQKFPRKELIQILCKYNQEIGNDAQALEQAQRLQNDDTFCVITGQQLGLCGGPSYTILKAISCLLLAKETGAVPIFWLATEDHDIAEINHSHILEQNGNLHEFRMHFPQQGLSVEDLILNADAIETIQAFLKAVDKPNYLFDLFPGQRYASVMASFLAKLFAGTGLVFLEPYLLRGFAKDFFHREIDQTQQIEELLNDTRHHLTMQELNPSVTHLKGSNLFMKDSEQHRRRVHFEDGSYSIGNKLYSKEEMLKKIDEYPELFSPNVLARPILQSKLLPTLAYVAGPNEMSYFLQLKDYFQFHEVPMPWVVPRISATLIPKEGMRLLEKAGLKAWDEIPLHWHDVMPDIDLHSKAAHVQLEKRGIPYFALHYLRNLINPHHKPQERVLNWMSLTFDTKENVIAGFLKEASWDQKGHYFCLL